MDANRQARAAGKKREICWLRGHSPIKPRSWTGCRINALHDVAKFGMCANGLEGSVLMQTCSIGLGFEERRRLHGTQTFDGQCRIAVNQGLPFVPIQVAVVPSRTGGTCEGGREEVLGLARGIGEHDELLRL